MHHDSSRQDTLIKAVTVYRWGKSISCSVGESNIGNNKRRVIFFFQVNSVVCSISGINFATPWTVPRQAPLSMDSLGKNTRVGSHSLPRGIFPTQEWNPGLLYCRQTLYHLSHQGIPKMGYWVPNQLTTWIWSVKSRQPTFRVQTLLHHRRLLVGLLVPTLAQWVPL